VVGHPGYRVVSLAEQLFQSRFEQLLEEIEVFFFHGGAPAILRVGIGGLKRVIDNTQTICCKVFFIRDPRFQALKAGDERRQGHGRGAAETTQWENRAPPSFSGSI
jgi:hypothetical protein